VLHHLQCHEDVCNAFLAALRVVVLENALSVAIKRLRDKLQAKEQIRTVYGIGYAWEV
jgi:DNA-binding response OmpR family regulator